MKHTTLRFELPQARLAAPLLLLLFAGLFAGTTAAQSAENYGDDYADGTYGRIRYEENGAAVTRAESEVRDEGLRASANMAVFPGDSVATAGDQRLEVQLAQGSLVRIDRNTRLTFLSLPDPYAEYRDHTVLQLAEGTLRVSASLAGSEEFRVDTPAVSVYLLGDADLRVETGSDGRTRVDSRRGVVEVAGNGGSVLVRGGMRAWARPGSIPDSAVAFNTFEADDFDRWVERLDDAYRASVDRAGAPSAAYEALPPEVRPQYVELSAHGDWVNSRDYGWVWAPRSVGPDWRPYGVGYWDYGPGGYFWVSEEPWGWAPYHYGRWTWIVGNGWCWVPGRVFAGAWVSWSWGPTYVGWSALDCWGYPIGYGPLLYGFYDPHVWIFVGYHDLYYGGHHHGRGHDHHYVSVDHVGGAVRDHAIVTRPPKTSPRELADSAQARAGATRAAATERSARAVRGAAARESSSRFDSIERTLAGRGERNLPPVAPASPPRQLTVPTAERGTGRGAPATATPTYPRSYPPRRSAPVPSAGSGRPESRPRGDGATGARPAIPRVEPRQSESGSRVRELYRSLARPRQTSTAPATPSRPGSARPAPTRQSPSPQARPRQGSTAPSSSRPAPARRPAQRSTTSSPSRSGGGKSQARPSSRGSSSRPAAPSRGSSRSSGRGSGRGSR